jgi:hypothetical protein
VVPLADAPLLAAPEVDPFIEVELPRGLLVWFVPAVGFVLEERLPLVELLPRPVVELPLLPATEPHGCPLKPVRPDIEGLFIPVPGLVVPGAAVDPGVPERSDPPLVLPLAPTLPPLDPPPLAPPPCANAAPPLKINAAARTDRIVPFCLIASTPVLRRPQQAKRGLRQKFP